MNGHLHVLVILSLGELPSVYIGEEGGWDPDLMWMQWWRERYGNVLLVIKSLDGVKFIYLHIIPFLVSFELSFSIVSLWITFHQTWALRPLNTIFMCHVQNDKIYIVIPHKISYIFSPFYFPMGHTCLQEYHTMKLEELNLISCH